MASKRASGESVPARCMFGDKCYSRNPQHFSKYRHPHLEEDFDAGNVATMPKTAREALRAQRDIINRLRGGPSEEERRPENEDHGARASSNKSDEGLLKSDKKTRLKSNGAGSKSGGGRHPKEGDAEAKLAAGAPMNVFYNKVECSPETHRDARSLYFSDLLHPSLGAIRRTLQISFLVELDWLMMNYELTKNETKPLTILSGELGAIEDESGCDLTEKYPNVEHAAVKSPYPFGTHHTKIMLIVYEDGSVRIAVLTSNLIGDDWLNRTQALWVSPKCPKMAEGCSSRSDGDSETKFKASLVRYLNGYESALLRPYTAAVLECDMTGVNAFFVGSIPGSHDVSPDPVKNFGHSCVAEILRRHVDRSTLDWTVVVQCSSIGSLGKAFEGSFLQELAESLNGCSSVPRDLLRFVYPTFDEVINAFGGPVYGSGCLPYAEETHRKQTWLDGFMCRWKADGIHRTRAMPHVKSYTKLNGAQDEAAFFMVTSSNLSKAAWGSLRKGNRKKLFILSYEAGILLLPKFTHGKATYRLGEDLVLPYDVPLTAYDPERDKPFFHTK